MSGRSVDEPPDSGALTHREEILFEQLRAFFARTRTAIMCAPLAWVLLMWIHLAHVELATALSWVTMVVVPDAVALMVASRFEHNFPRPERYAFWRHRQHMLHGLAGLAWGASVFFFVRPGDIQGELVTYVFLVAISATCVTALSPFRSAVAVFTVCIALPPMFVMMRAGDAFHWQLLAGTVALVVVENIFGWVANRELMRGIEQAVSNRRLNEALLLTRDELHRANIELAAKNRELTGMTQSLRELAMHDDLTGCYNRRYLIRHIEEEIALCARHDLAAALLMLDLDHFKKVNDECGHLAGDAVLREMTEIVKASLRDSDIFARYGGEEFVAVLRMTDAHEAMNLAERLRKQIAEHVFEAISDRRQVTVSIGVAEFQPGDTADGWLERADSALYQAKVAGRNRVTTYAQLSLPVQPDAEIAFARRSSVAGESVSAIKGTGSE